MRVNLFDWKTTGIYLLILSAFIILSLCGNHAVAVFSDVNRTRTTVIIDAGHGGVDGGAVSCTGVRESKINLEIAIKLNDLMHLLGVRTMMIRETDRSVYTDGKTIAAKKVSDIKERVRIVNTTPNALLVSIHQNSFQDARYCGAQIFYNHLDESKNLAEKLQTTFHDTINPNNHRQIKRTSGIYLMEHINTAGILIECGFLSNPFEESMLRNSAYQRQISCVIAAAISQYLNT